MDADKIFEELKKEIVLRMNTESIVRIRSCLSMLNEDEIWSRPNENSNSVGNMILHLCGNVRQYLVSSIGGKVDNRNRNAEFKLNSRVSKDALLLELSNLEKEVLNVTKKMKIEELMRKRKVQGFEMNGLQIIIHVIEHFSYHTGQIAYYTKLLKNQDLKFYGDMDLDVIGS